VEKERGVYLHLLENGAGFKLSSLDAGFCVGEKNKLMTEAFYATMLPKACAAS
jgi:hypothetical protein